MKRPWRGMNPWKLAVRGLVHLVIAGVVAWACVQVRTGDHDIAVSELGDQDGTIERVATIVLVLAIALGLSGLVRVVVGTLDIVRPRREVHGRLVAARERATGDFLPWIAQLLIYRGDGRSGRSRDEERQRWLEIVVDTDDGRHTFTVRPQVFATADPGTAVAVRASRILGHVVAVVPLRTPI